MFNVGGGEMVALFLLALVVLGPERLPKAMGQVGRAVGQLRRMSSGFQDEIRRAMDPDDAPFRPGEEVLSGPPPGIEDEVRVVGADPETDVPDGDPATAVDHPDADPATAAEEPPDLVPGDVPDDDSPPPPPVGLPPAPGAEGSDATVSPLRPAVDDGDRAAG